MTQIAAASSPELASHRLDIPPFHHVTKTITLEGDNIEAKREEIRKYFHDTYTLYEKLFEVLKSDDIFYMRPEPLRHPLVFYFGHTAALYINKLVLGKYLSERINPRIESLVAVGVDEMSWDDLNEAHYDWPTIPELREYRQKVRQVLDRLIRTLPLTLPITWESPFWAILMGIEHERIHLETSTVLIRQLPIHTVQNHSLWPVCPTYRADLRHVPANELVQVEGRQLCLGKSKENGKCYGWDNEYGQLKVTVPSFKTSKYLVSNKEFLEFMNDGGYTTEEYWTEEGWKWRNYRKATHPIFWVEKADGTYLYRNMTCEVEMPWDWPVDVNYLEAKAFCNWKAKKTGKKIRLPSEDEWYVLRDSVFGEEYDQFNWRTGPGNINFEHWASATPIDMFMHKGFGDVIGNVWQWTETPIDSFDGFEIHPLYDDFSTPTFDTRHNLIKGGSWISTGNEATRDSRYAFRRHFFQHAGFRYVESDTEIVIRDNPYETDKEVTRLIELQYGPSYFNIPNYDLQLAQAILEAYGNRPFDRALNVGCGTGRLVFELAKHFEYVLGTDRTARIIQVAWRIHESGKTRYAIQDEGKITDFCDVYYDLSPEVASRIEFKQENPCNITDRHGRFDLIILQNQIEIVADPAECIKSAVNLLNPGGILIITSNYYLDESFTPQDKWLGGFKKAAENYRTLDGIADLLRNQFKYHSNKTKDFQYAVRLSRRKFEFNISQFTCWEKL